MKIHTAISTVELHKEARAYDSHHPICIVFGGVFTVCWHLYIIATWTVGEVDSHWEGSG
jgi:hypothetical protein